MKTEVVTMLACVGHSQMLGITLDNNHSLLKHIYVCTKPDDNDTKNVCSKYKNVTVVEHDFLLPVTYFKTHQKRYEIGGMNNPAKTFKTDEDMQKKIDLWNSKGNIFNRGGAIRKCQELANQQFHNHIHLHLDVDIMLPDKFVDVINDTQIEPHVLYVPSGRRDYKCMKSYKKQSGYTKKYARSGFGFFQLYRFPDRYIYHDDYKNTLKHDVWFRDDIMRFSGKKDSNRKKILPFNVDHLGTDGKGLHQQGEYMPPFIF